MVTASTTPYNASMPINVIILRLTVKFDIREIVKIKLPDTLQKLDEGDLPKISI